MLGHERVGSWSGQSPGGKVCQVLGPSQGGDLAQPSVWPWGSHGVMALLGVGSIPGSTVPLSRTAVQPFLVSGEAEMLLIYSSLGVWSRVGSRATNIVCSAGRGWAPHRAGP
jgi:hypothetical protein